MSKKRLFLAGIPETHVAQSIHRAQRLGFEVIMGDSEDHLLTYAHLIRHADQQVVVDYTQYENLSAVVESLQQDRPLDSIFSFKERGLHATARVAQDYDLVGNQPEAINACINKFSTRTRLQAAGLASPAFALCSSVDQIRAFQARVAGAIIIKPYNLQGSVGVGKVEPGEDIEPAYRVCIAQSHEPTVLVEEFLAGQEVSIEACLYRGQVVVFGITEKLLYPGTFTEAGHISPYQGQELTREQYTSLVRHTVDALGITFGPLHIEGFHTKRGFIIGEVHTRYGGDSIVTLTELARKCDMISPVFAELGNIPHSMRFGQPQEVATIRYLDVEPGYVTSITGIEAVRDIPGIVDVTVTCQVGDVVRPIRSSFDRVGWILAKGATRGELQRIVEQACDRLRVTTQPQP